MEEKAKEMINKLGDSYTIWDLCCLACIVLVNVSATTSELKEPTKIIVGTLIDGNIILKESLRDGILPFQKQPKPS